jgi:nitroreductase
MALASAFVANPAATALRRAAVRATLAPSVHNSQPWRLYLRGGRLDVCVDRSRQLAVLDSTAREMFLSVGCAVTNARVSAAAGGLDLVVRRFPDPHAPDLVARLEPGRGAPDAELALLDDVVESRRTNRRPFTGNDVTPTALAAFEKAAAAEGTSLVVVGDAKNRALVLELNRLAEAIGSLDPAYRAELRAWTSEDALRAAEGADDPSAPALPEAPADDACLVVLCTAGDEPVDWLRAGEAMERIFLEVARLGYAATPLPAVTRVPSARGRLQNSPNAIGHPQMVVRIGSAPPTPASRRRRLVDVLFTES